MYFTESTLLEDGIPTCARRPFIRCNTACARTVRAPLLGLLWCPASDKTRGPHRAQVEDLVDYKNINGTDYYLVKWKGEGQPTSARLFGGKPGGFRSRGIVRWKLTALVSSN